MELHYQITERDYIDFNLNYYVNNAIVQRSILLTRVMTAVLVMVGGIALLSFTHRLGMFSVSVYAALAAACFFGIPWYMKRKVVKNTGRILRNANNRQLCGPKTLTLRKDEFELAGENEDTVYRYEAVQRIASDGKHYFIYVDEFSAIIVPFSAFQSEQHRQAFYRRITGHMDGGTMQS